MNQHHKILNQIAAIRDLHPQMEYICRNGSCMNFHVVLRRIYPDAIAYFNIYHVITKIGDKYYDITGSVSPKGYMPITSFYDKRNTKRAINQMMKYLNEDSPLFAIQKELEEHFTSSKVQAFDELITYCRRKQKKFVEGFLENDASGLDVLDELLKCGVIPFSTYIKAREVVMNYNVPYEITAI